MFVSPKILNMLTHLQSKSGINSSKFHKIVTQADINFTFFLHLACLTEVFSMLCFSHWARKAILIDSSCLLPEGRTMKNYWMKKKKKEKKLKNTYTHVHKLAWSHVSSVPMQPSKAVCYLYVPKHKFFISSMSRWLFNCDKVFIMLLANQQRWDLSFFIFYIHIHMWIHKLH